jgi:hypothetical protein
MPPDPSRENLNIPASSAVLSCEVSVICDGQRGCKLDPNAVDELLMTGDFYAARSMNMSAVKTWRVSWNEAEGLCRDEDDRGDQSYGVQQAGLGAGRRGNKVIDAKCKGRRSGRLGEWLGTFIVARVLITLHQGKGLVVENIMY